MCYREVTVKKRNVCSHIVEYLSVCVDFKCIFSTANGVGLVYQSCDVHLHVHAYASNLMHICMGHLTQLHNK